ncbi:MAG: SpoIIE family protein phosphatase [Bacteroidales bacterium]|nr:SpoIIE family protein phosphatase [Bacteroidales bacterium]
MKYVVLLTLFLVAILGRSEKIISLNHGNIDDVNFPEYIYILEDAEGKFSLEQVILAKHNLFEQNHQALINLGFTSSVYWLRFSVKNETKSLQNFVFAIQNPLIAKIDFIGIKNNKPFEHIRTGESRPYISRNIQNRNFLFDLTIESGQQLDYYVRVDNQGGPLQIPMVISPYQSYLNNDHGKFIGLGGLMGMFVLIIVINLFILIIDKARFNIYYTIYVAILTLFIANVSGLNYEFIWPSNPTIQRYATLVFGSFANVFLILFSQQFFNLQRFFYRIYKISNLLILFSFLIISISFWNTSSYVLALKLLNIYSLVTIVFLTLTAIRGVTKNMKIHYYFMLSFFFFLLGVGSFVSYNLGFHNQRTWAYGGLYLGFLSEVILLMFAVLHKYRKIELQTNQELEYIVKERTHELEIQKQELLEQKTEIIYQRDKIIAQHRRALKQSEIISKKNNEINSSIAYAKIIQNAVMPPKSLLDKSFKSYFILNQPKEVIGGDFYWFHEKNQRAYLAVADCTGHGIPCAMISMLGIAALNEIMLKTNELTPSEILNKLSSVVSRSLHQRGEMGETKDSMDISLCMIDKITNTLLMSGSNNPIYIYREEAPTEHASYIANYEFDDNSLMVVMPDKLTIGYNENLNLSFTDKKINLMTNDMIYLFSDGYIDQFGGYSGKKLKRNKFRKLLSENASIDSQRMQHQHLEKHFEQWSVGHEQIDDVMVLGVRY